MENNYCPNCGIPVKQRYIGSNQNAIDVINKLIKEFDNPDNHAHQRDAIENANEFLNSVKHTT